MEDFELYKHIYQDCEMSIFSLNTLLTDLEKKDNKIKDTVEDIKNGYTRYFEEVIQLLDNNIPRKKGKMAKMVAGMGIDKKVQKDNSDSSIADMLIKGVSMGALDVEKKISNYKDKADKKELKFAEDFLQFQQDVITGLKKFL